MIDILYVVGKGFSEWHDNELRYSLRSIAKNGINVGRVVVVGHCPYWLNEDEVVLLPLKDTTNDKHTNILNAIEYAVEQGVLGERFLYSSDDHYYVQPTDFATYPAYKRPYDLPTLPTDHKPTWYETTMSSTREVLEAFGLPVTFYAWHGNTWFNTRLWKQSRMVLLRRLAKTMPSCCDPSTLMLNYWKAVETDTMPKEVVRKDEKVGAQSLEDIRKMAKAKEVLSTTDAVAADMRTFLQQTFKTPCKYERRMD